MELQQLIIIFSGLLMLAVLLRTFMERFHIPFPAVLVVAGIIGEATLSQFDIELIIDADSFRNIIIYVLLPVMVFEAAFKIDVQRLFKNILPIFFLAIPLFLLSTFITAVLIYLGIGNAETFPWMAALLTGTLLSNTDTIAIMEQLERIGVPDRLITLLDGEGILNDATAIVIFSIFTFILLNPDISMNTGDKVVIFLAVYFGGIIVGLITGLIFMLISRICHGPILHGINTMISAYTAYFVAEELLQVSGVMSVLVTGMILGRFMRFHYGDGKDHFVNTLWTFNNYIADSTIFLLTGITLTMALFLDHSMAILIGISGVFIARAIGIYGMLPIICLLPSGKGISFNYRTAMFWSGSRGAVTLALALSIPSQFIYSETIRSIAFGAVLFSLFITAPSLSKVLKKLNLET